MKPSPHKRDALVDTETMFWLSPRRHLPNYSRETAKLPSFQLPFDDNKSDEGLVLLSDDDSDTKSSMGSASECCDLSYDSDGSSSNNGQESTVTFRIKRQKPHRVPSRAQSEELVTLKSPVGSPSIRKTKSFGDSGLKQTLLPLVRSPGRKGRPSSAKAAEERQSIHLHSTGDMSEVSLNEITSIHSRTGHSFKSFGSTDTFAAGSISEDRSRSKRTLPSIPASPDFRGSSVGSDVMNISEKSRGYQNATTPRAGSAETHLVKDHDSKRKNRSLTSMPSPPLLSPTNTPPTHGNKIMKLSAFFEGKTPDDECFVQVAFNAKTSHAVALKSKKVPGKVKVQQVTDMSPVKTNVAEIGSPQTPPSSSILRTCHELNDIKTKLDITCVQRGQVAKATAVYLSPKKSIKDCIGQTSPSSDRTSTTKSKKLSGKVTSVLAMFEKNKQVSPRPSPIGKSNRRLPPPRISSPMDTRCKSPRKSRLEHIRNVFETSSASSSQIVKEIPLVSHICNSAVNSQKSCLLSESTENSPRGHASLSRDLPKARGHSLVKGKELASGCPEVAAHGKKKSNSGGSKKLECKPSPKPPKLFSPETEAKMNASLSRLDDSFWEPSFTSLDSCRPEMEMDERAYKVVCPVEVPCTPESSRGIRRREQFNKSNSHNTSLEDEALHETADKEILRKQIVCTENVRPLGFHLIPDDKSTRTVKTLELCSKNSESHEITAQDNCCSMPSISGAAKMPKSDRKGSRIKDIIRAMGMR